MATKRGPSPELISNPFIKRQNLEWSLEPSGSTRKSDRISNSNSNSSSDEKHSQGPGPKENHPETSAVEAGSAQISDHLGYFGGHLAGATLSPFPPGTPRLSIDGYRRLYEANAGNPVGAHFVMHQHDHPVAGTHYDLRLQINETSSASWAIMYGLPGDPNSQRLNRNATETRIHCLWNHLIETASSATGSLLIWDTGTYTVLPPSGHEGGSSRRKTRATTDSQSSSGDGRPPSSSGELTEQEKLRRAFQARKISLRLDGARLPRDYVLNLRLTRDEDAAGRERSSARASTRRRRGRGGAARGRGRGRGKGKAIEPAASSSDSDVYGEDSDNDVDGEEGEGIANAGAPAEVNDGDTMSAMEREVRELEDEQVRRTNAYPGAANSIGSVHQRRWYVSLDRAACGFTRRRGARGRVVWEKNSERDGDAGEDRLAFPFYVRGPDVERSVVTGRLGADVLMDEGVEGYISRRGWRPVLN